MRCPWVKTPWAVSTTQTCGVESCCCYDRSCHAHALYLPYKSVCVFANCRLSCWIILTIPQKHTQPSSTVKVPDFVTRKIVSAFILSTVLWIACSRYIVINVLYLCISSSLVSSGLTVLDVAKSCVWIREDLQIRSKVTLIFTVAMQSVRTG